MQEADKAEVQNYYFSQKIDRMKASFAGTKFAIIRIITSLLPICGVLIPFIKVKSSAPLSDYSGALGAIDLYNGISKGKIDFNAILGLMNSGETKTTGLLIVLSAVFLVLSLVFTLTHLLMLFLSCSKRGKKRNYAQDIIIIACMVISAILFMCVPKTAYFTGELYFGAPAAILLAAANFFFDYLAYKKAKPIKHKLCVVGAIPIEEYFKMIEDGATHDEIRAEQYKRLNALQEEQEKVVAEEYKEAEERKEAILHTKEHGAKAEKAKEDAENAEKEEAVKK